MREDTHDGGLELAPPPETPGITSMAERVAQRLFGGGSTQRLGRYLIERRIGRGGMGVVYAAHDPELSRRVALKILRTDRESAEARAQLLDEARILARLSHPNVVQIYEVGVHEDQLYLAMEFIEGETLDRFALTRARARIMECCVQAGRGVAAAHAVGVLHRDLKPNNILVGSDGRVRVLDFGLARAAPVSLETPPSPLDEDVDEDTTHLRGTPPYVAPELYAGESPSAMSDQFAYCVTLWQVLEGRRPFEVEALVNAAKQGGLPLRSSLRPRWLHRTLAKGLSSNPRQRWASMDALLHELETRPKQRRLSLAFAGLALGVGLLATSSSPAPSSQICEGAPTLAGVWDPPTRAQLAHGLSELDQSRAAIELALARLDRSAAAWAEARELACAQSGPGIEATLSCLERDRVQLETVTTALGAKDTSTPSDPRVLLAQLRDPFACLAPGRRTPAPSPEQAEAAARLRESADRIAAQVVDHPLAGDAAIEEALREARELGFEPVLAEFLLLDAQLAARLFQRERALESGRSALRFAKASGALELELRCLDTLAQLAIDQLEDPERAEDLLPAMFGALAQLGEPAALHQRVLVTQAALEQLRGEPERAERSLRRALALESDPPGSLAREEIQRELANALAEQGRVDEALKIYTALLERRRELLGAEHPGVADLHFDLALTRYAQGALDEARAHIETARAINTRAFGADSTKLAPTFVVHAQILAASGELDAALAATERGWELERSLAAGHSERGNSLRVRLALLGALEDYPAALTTAEQIELELHAAMSERERGMISHNIGWLLCRVGAYERARPRFETALLRDDRDIALFAQIGMAELELHAGQIVDARARLDQALRELEQLDTEEAAEALAEARYWRFEVDLAAGIRGPELHARARSVHEAYSELSMPTWIHARLDPYTP